MASRCSTFINRTSISSLKSAIRSASSSSRPSSRPTFATSSSPLPRSTSSPVHRFSSSRVRNELGCAASMLPLHSAVAVARMTSCLSTTSRSCRALLQEIGLSTPR